MELRAEILQNAILRIEIKGKYVLRVFRTGKGLRA
jgi:hypothetical protein